MADICNNPDELDTEVIYESCTRTEYEYNSIIVSKRRMSQVYNETDIDDKEETYETMIRDIYLYTFLVDTFAAHS